MIMYQVMLVDDEKWILESLRATVNWADFGFKVIGTAANGIEGYERIAEARPDAAFIDVRMPGRNGLELIGKLKEAGIPTKCVIASGFAEFEYAHQAIRYGAVGYCLKPFQAEEIAETLRTVKIMLDREKSSSAAGPAWRIPDEAETSADGESAIGRRETFACILKYIHENINEPMTIQDIARLFFMHPNYLSTLFKKELDVNFTKYVTDLRLEQACALLKNSTLSVGEIAERVGYRDYFYFAKLFRKHLGSTPTEYREMQAEH